ncbi:hypothetical protein RA278_28100, partial [Pseudomonas syringae pv. tagetis]
PKYEQRVSFLAPILLTVDGVVKDPQQLMRDREPMNQRAMRDSPQQSQRSILFDAPHVEKGGNMAYMEQLQSGKNYLELAAETRPRQLDGILSPDKAANSEI